MVCSLSKHNWSQGPRAYYLTDTNRRALFGIYNAAADGDWHHAYYQHEAKGRRANGTKGIGGKANIFFTGTGIVQQQEASAKL